jgi:hypothetical protein
MMFDKNGAVIDNGDSVSISFKVISVDNEGALLVETIDTPAVPFRCPPEFSVKASSARASKPEDEDIL